MPELPEVETMVRGIRKHVTGRTIRDFVQCPNRCKPISLKPSFASIRKRLVGKSFSAVRRLGKRVVLDVYDGFSLVVEPRMTGLVLLGDPPDVEHLRMRWDFDGHSTFDSLWFWDRRGLGTMTLIDSSQLDASIRAGKLGPDALEMSPNLWRERCTNSKREIKVFLLDQKVVAGIGNLYASEILHRAAVNPMTPAGSLSSDSIERLSAAVLTVLTQAIELQGSTLGDGTYRTALNERGGYQHEHRVYMKEGTSCVVCKQGIITRIVQAQRSTFFCPNCQRPSKKVKKETNLK